MKPNKTGRTDDRKDVIVEPVPPAPEHEVIKPKPQKEDKPKDVKVADQPTVLDQTPWEIHPKNKRERSRPDTLRTRVYTVIMENGPVTIEEAAKKVAEQLKQKYDATLLGRVRGCFQKLDGDQYIRHHKAKKGEADHK